MLKRDISNLDSEGPNAGEEGEKAPLWLTVQDTDKVQDTDSGPVAELADALQETRAGFCELRFLAQRQTNSALQNKAKEYFPDSYGDYTHEYVGSGDQSVAILKDKSGLLRYVIPSDDLGLYRAISESELHGWYMDCFLDVCRSESGQMLYVDSRTGKMARTAEDILKIQPKASLKSVAAAEAKIKIAKSGFNGGKRLEGKDALADFDRYVRNLRLYFADEVTSPRIDQTRIKQILLVDSDTFEVWTVCKIANVQGGQVCFFSSEKGSSDRFWALKIGAGDYSDNWGIEQVAGLDARFDLTQMEHGQLRGYGS